MLQYPWLRAAMSFYEVEAVEQKKQFKYIGGRGVPIGLLSQINHESRQFALSKGFIPISATQDWYWRYGNGTFPDGRRFRTPIPSSTVFWINPKYDQFAIAYQPIHKRNYVPIRPQMG